MGACDHHIVVEVEWLTLQGKLVSKYCRTGDVM